VGWADAGVTPRVATEWSAAGVAEPVAAADWREAGLAPRDALAWSWLWGGRRRRSYRSVNTPSPSASHLTQVVAWLRGGVGPGEAALWTAAGLRPSEAALLPPGHEDRPDEDRLRLLAALRP
jgi:hypothetical protein